MGTWKILWVRERSIEQPPDEMCLHRESWGGNAFSILMDEQVKLFSVLFFWEQGHLLLFHHQWRVINNIGEISSDGPAKVKEVESVYSLFLSLLTFFRIISFKRSKKLQFSMVWFLLTYSILIKHMLGNIRIMNIWYCNVTGYNFVVNLPLTALERSADNGYCGS